MEVRYVHCCPNCNYVLERSSENRTKRLPSPSCPRFSSLLGRKMSVTREKANQSKGDLGQPIICDNCQRRVIRTNCEKWVRPLFPEKSLRKLENAFLQRNFMQVLYGTLVKDYLCETVSSYGLITDCESFLRSTEYIDKKIENDLKEKLLEESFKPELRHRPNNAPRQRDSDKLRMIFLNEARDNSLQPSISCAFSGDTLSNKTCVSTPSNLTLTETCYDGSWKHSPKKNSQFQASQLCIDNHNVEPENKNIMAKVSTFTKSKSDFIAKPVQGKLTKEHRETQYSLKILKPVKKKKKRKLHLTTTRKSSLVKMYSEEQINLTDPWKLHFNNKANRENWMLVQKPKTLKETGVSTKDGLPTILEDTHISWQPESVRQQVMYINPPPIVIKSFVITRENTDTQCNIISTPKSETCKCNSRYFCEKSCQYSEQKLVPYTSRYKSKEGRNQQDHILCISHALKHQNSKVIQSPCPHNPPCKLVPSCFHARLKIQ